MTKEHDERTMLIACSIISALAYKVTVTILAFPELIEDHEVSDDIPAIKKVEKLYYSCVNISTFKY